MRQSFKDGFSLQRVARDASLYIADRITTLSNLRYHLAVFVAQVWLAFSALLLQTQSYHFCGFILSLKR